MPTTITSLHLIIHGRVQGVGYRAWMEKAARTHGLSGWVRNRREGTVEAVLAGAPHAISAILAECYKGPMAARVTRIVHVPWDGEVTPAFQSLPTT